MELKDKTKAGFVAVLGRPNAGKSTLLNYIAGQKLAMVSKKAQATRKRMLIIHMHKNTQMIFVDTPGIHKSERLLNRYMLDEALKAMGDSDLIIYLAPVTDKLEKYEKFLQKLKSKRDQTHIIALSKIDFVDNATLLKKLSEYQKYQDRFEAIVPISVKKETGIDALLDEIDKKLPSSAFLFDPEMPTTETIKQIYKELIRESIFENISDEIPYESDVLVESVEQRDNIDIVNAQIITEKNTQKAMIIGKNGQTIKRIGKHARSLMSQLLEKKIYLDLQVKVKKGWSKQRESLKQMGYEID